MLNINYTKDYYLGKDSDNPEPGGYDNYPETAYANESAEWRAVRIMYKFKLRRNASILVVGCAYGFLVKALVELGFDAYGIDISEFAVSQANNPRVLLGDARDENCFKHYDLIFSENMICCLSDEDILVFSGLAKKYGGKVGHLFSDNTRLIRVYNYRKIDQLKALAGESKKELWFSLSEWRK